ncbi:MAG: ribosome recycling factor [Flavobacteriaceae bacterium]|tara:strand:- start:625 stop:1179 length:555 start_codon:yes stop_codon:yes gene_type:complete
MNEELDFIIQLSKEKMEESLSHLDKSMVNIRAGKANPNMLNIVKLDYYGTLTPLSQISNISTPDARTLSINPWEKSMLQEIEKAIQIADLGFNPMNNGDSIIINIPALTEERRRELAKMAKMESERTKVTIRHIRKDANNDIKKTDVSKDLQNNYEVDIQDLTDLYISKVDSIYLNKEKEILTV